MPEFSERAVVARTHMGGKSATFDPQQTPWRYRRNIPGIHRLSPDEKCYYRQDFVLRGYNVADRLVIVCFVSTVFVGKGISQRSRLFYAAVAYIVYKTHELLFIRLRDCQRCQDNMAES